PCYTQIRAVLTLALVRSTLWHRQHTVGSLHLPSLLTLLRKSKHPTSTRKAPFHEQQHQIDPISNHPTSTTSKRSASKKIIASKMSGICSLCQPLPQKSCVDWTNTSIICRFP